MYFGASVPWNFSSKLYTVIEWQFSTEHVYQEIGKCRKQSQFLLEVFPRNGFSIHSIRFW